LDFQGVSGEEFVDEGAEGFGDFAVIFVELEKEDEPSADIGEDPVPAFLAFDLVFVNQKEGFRDDPQAVLLDFKILER
jgi:hypothetical protein